MGFSTFGILNDNHSTMRKLLLFYITCFITTTTWAQIPAGYYDGTSGLTGSALKTKLSEIISNGHIDRGYSNLYTGYQTSDTDNFYEKDGSVLDMYSEDPAGKDPYTYQHNQKRCGNYKNEGDCYNREHIVPQSLFNKSAPMVSDIHSVRPTDGKVNSMRSNYPFGEVDNPNIISKNGSKVGSNSTSGFSGTVFEPINEFKGDIARMVFYFVTRYESKLPSFSNGNMLSGAKYPGIEDWQLNILLKWAAQDPVSPVEIARNNASYDYQKNRNPYIDHPEWVEAVFGTPSIDTTPPSPPANLSVTSTTVNSVSLQWTVATDNIAVTGYDIYMDGVLTTSVGDTTIATVTGLAPSTTYQFYIIAKDAANNKSVATKTVQGTTKSGGNGGNATSLYISEYLEGSSYNKAIEISNNTASAVNLAGYSLKKQSNGSGPWINEIPLSGTLQPGKAYVVTEGKFALTCSHIEADIETSSLDFNGNDPVGLFYNGTLIDIVGNLDGGKANFAKDMTLRRKAAKPSTTFDITEWDKIPKDDCSNLGIVNPVASLSTIETTAKQFSIYPNPVNNGKIYISGNEAHKIAKAQLFSITGKLVQAIDRPFKTSNQLRLPNLPHGIYILKLDMETHKIIIK